MATNGVAVALPVEPTPTQAKPAAPPAATAIQVGEAVADAVEALGRGLAEGGAPMRAETRALNGEKLAAIVEIWLHHFGEIDDFRGLAQREGVRALRARHGEALRQQIGADCSEQAITGTFDELCGHIVTIAGQVAAIEAVYRSN
jgi:hypothetical protein